MAAAEAEMLSEESGDGNVTYRHRLETNVGNIIYETHRKHRAKTARYSSDDILREPKHRFSL